jgi:hypothetical protein
MLAHRMDYVRLLSQFGTGITFATVIKTFRNGIKIIQFSVVMIDEISSRILNYVIRKTL